MPWDPDVICRGRRYFCKSLLFFDVWFWRYLSWPDTLVEVIACLRCLILMLFVVAGGTLESYGLPLMLDFDAICGVPEHLAILLFAFDAWFWCYLSWPDVLLKVSACLQKLTLNAICRGRTSFVFSCFFSEVDFECYLSWTHVLLEFTACFQKLAFAIVLPFVVAMLSFRSWLWMLFVVFGVTFGGTICNF